MPAGNDATLAICPLTEEAARLDNLRDLGRDHALPTGIAQRNQSQYLTRQNRQHVGIVAAKLDQGATFEQVAIQGADSGGKLYVRSPLMGLHRLNRHSEVICSATVAIELSR